MMQTRTGSHGRRDRASRFRNLGAFNTYISMPYSNGSTSYVNEGSQTDSVCQLFSILHVLFDMTHSGAVCCGRGCYVHKGSSQTICSSSDIAVMECELYGRQSSVSSQREQCGEEDSSNETSNGEPTQPEGQLGADFTSSLVHFSCDLTGYTWPGQMNTLFSAQYLQYKWALKSSHTKCRFNAFLHCQRTATVLIHATLLPSFYSTRHVRKCTYMYMYT